MDRYPNDEHYNDGINWVIKKLQFFLQLQLYFLFRFK